MRESQACAKVRQEPQSDTGSAEPYLAPIARTEATSAPVELELVVQSTQDSDSRQVVRNAQAGQQTPSATESERLYDKLEDAVFSWTVGEVLGAVKGRIKKVRAKEAEAAGEDAQQMAQKAAAQTGEPRLKAHPPKAPRVAKGGSEPPATPR